MLRSLFRLGERLRTRFLSILLPTCLAGLALVTSVRAESEQKVRLVLEAGPGTELCIGVEELERLVEVELERAVFVKDADAGARTIRVRLEIAASGAGYRAFVSRDAAEPKSAETPPAGVVRELGVAGGCRELDEPLSLVVALLADTEEDAAASSVEDDAALPPPEPEPPPPPEEIQPLGPVTTAPGWEAFQREAHWELEADAAGAAGVGMLPSVGFGGELGFLAEPPSFPSFRVRLLAMTSAPVEPVPNASVDFVYAVAGAALCPKLSTFSSGNLRLCLGADLGALHAWSQGLAESRRTTRYFGQVSAALRGSLRLGGGFLGTLGAGVLFPTRVDRFVYRNDGQATEIFEMAFVPFLATAGVTYEIR